MPVPAISCCFLKPDKVINFVLGNNLKFMLRQTIMIITNVLVSVSLSRTKNPTHIFAPVFVLTEILLINIINKQ